MWMHSCERLLLQGCRHGWHHPFLRRRSGLPLELPPFILVLPRRCHGLNLFWMNLCEVFRFATVCPEVVELPRTIRALGYDLPIGHAQGAIVAVVEVERFPRRRRRRFDRRCETLSGEVFLIGGMRCLRAG